MSFVVIPNAIDFSTALSIASASSSKPKCFNNIAADKIEAKGFAISLPFAFGKEPWIGSNNAFFSPIEEEANKPIEPAIALASS